MWLNKSWHSHYQVVPPARISLTLSRQSSLLFIASNWSSGLHPVSSYSCWMYVRAGFHRPCEGVHRRTSLMSLSPLLQQCPACLVRLTLIVFVMGGWWPYSWCFMGCCPDIFSFTDKMFRDVTTTQCSSTCAIPPNEIETRQTFTSVRHLSLSYRQSQSKWRYF